MRDADTIDNASNIRIEQMTRDILVLSSVFVCFIHDVAICANFSWYDVEPRQPRPWRLLHKIHRITTIG